MILKTPSGRISLEARLLLLAGIVMLAALVGTLAFQLHNARQAIVSEVGSSMRFASSLLATFMRTGGPSAETELRDLGAALDAMRHVRVSLSLDSRPPPRAIPDDVPDWFARHVVPSKALLPAVVLPDAGGQHSFVIEADPGDELREIWSDARVTFAFALGGAGLLLALLFAALRLGLQPLSRLLGAFEALERGQFAVRVDEQAAPELQRIHRGFNHVASALERMVDDNRRLTATLMSVQEDERKTVAHDLHDEMAPQLFCVRVGLAGLRSVELPAAARAQLEAVEADVVALQNQVRRMLARLRPYALQAFGFEDALADLVASWQQRAPDIEWQLEFHAPGLEVPETIATDLYRVVQESLTNIARHAEARRASVSVVASAGALRLAVRDDGRGIAPGAARGYGLLGIAERARRLGGSCQIKRVEPGTEICVSVELARLAAREGAGD